jgi:hypothetical protein
MAVGGVSIFLALRAPQNYTQADQDGDGAADTFYYYNGQVQSRTEQDRNADGRIDSRWFHDIHGVADRQEYDDDFDGRFEWRATLDGFMAEHVLDVDGNGNPERVQHYRYDVLRDVDIYRGGRVVARGIYNSERQISIEFDADGDGVFERRVNLDELGEPVPR